MKIQLLSALLFVPSVLFAQTQQRGTTVQTERQQSGTSHQSSHSTMPSEHKSHAEWHYHRGQKRPQVPYDTLPGNLPRVIETGHTDSAWHNKHDK